MRKYDEIEKKIIEKFCSKDYNYSDGIVNILHFIISEDDYIIYDRNQQFLYFLFDKATTNVITKSISKVFQYLSFIIYLVENDYLIPLGYHINDAIFNVFNKNMVNYDKIEDINFEKYPSIRFGNNHKSKFDEEYFNITGKDPNFFGTKLMDILLKSYIPSSKLFNLNDNNFKTEEEIKFERELEQREKQHKATIEKMNEDIKERERLHNENIEMMEKDSKDRDKQFKTQKRLTWAAIIASIVTSGVSIYLEYFKSEPTKLDNDQLQRIERVLEKK